jgi:hypothetical protein
MERRDPPRQYPAALTFRPGQMAAMASRPLRSRDRGIRPSPGPYPPSRVLPGDHENRVALVHQVFHHGIPGRQVEDVVFHDPGRDEQDRFRLDFRRGRFVLDQFHEPVPEDHRSGGAGQVFSHAETFGAGRPFMSDLALDVVEPVLPASPEVHASLLQGAVEDDRVGPGVVGGGKHVQDLTGHEIGHVLVVVRRPPEGVVRRATTAGS